jgi:predicted NBD/HSP70 family sugar kinase
MSEMRQRRVAESLELVKRAVLERGPATADDLLHFLQRQGTSITPPVLRARLRDLGALVTWTSAGEAGVLAPRRSVGKPPRLVEITSAWGVGLAAEVGAHVVRVGLVAPNQGLVVQRELPRPDGGLSTALDVAARIAADAVRSSSSGAALRGIAVAIPQAVPHPQPTGRPASERLIVQLAFADLIRGSDDLTLDVISDVQARALGEARFGLARDRHSALVVKASGRIACALVVGGECIPGFSGLGGEIGHLPVSHELASHRARCTCGDTENRHLAAYASTDAVIARVRRTTRWRGTTFSELLAEPRTLTIQCVLQDAARLIGTVIAPVVAATDPEVVVLVGQLPRGGEPVRAAIAEAISDACPGRSTPVLAHPPESADAAAWVGVRGAGRMAIRSAGDVGQPSRPVRRAA